MKKLFIFIYLSATVSMYAGNNTTTMTPIMNRAEEIVKYIEDDMNLEIVRMEYDILRTSKATTRYLSHGWTYMIVAFGDFRFKDIDVKVYRKDDGNWQEIGKDNDDSSVAIVYISPEQDAEYGIEITAYSFNEGYEVGHYGLIIAHE